ncbi:unnamed protein product [Phytophthora fragariaefolia]|uniref:Unnamed protein product n=1 Tax=Phytophthora fragariaefolia TaxID=1490495 RepID=A0A9W6Y7W7_9STRA|nr:unnamed protein product [Phytophthora fragariaefolia]
MRAVSVKTAVTQAFWEGPTVLRAMAVYLRDRIYIWDVVEEYRAYAQQYFYKTYTMENGDSHETGTITTVPESQMRDVLQACFDLHVLPTMLIPNHSEGHFYGIQHGDTFHEWHAQRGPEMRARLDRVRTTVGMPVLPSDGYDPDSVEAEAAFEEQALLEEMEVDFYASGSQESTSSDTKPIRVQRARADAGAAVHRHVYEHLLRTADPQQRDAIDTRLATRLTRANDGAFQHWATSAGRSFGLPVLSEGVKPLTAAFDWLSENPSAFRHASAYLPYPELAVQGCTRSQLLRWGGGKLIYTNFKLSNASGETKTIQTRRGDFVPVGWKAAGRQTHKMH